MSLFFAVSGTLINAVAVLVGGLLGTVAGNRLPQRLHDALFGALGLFTVLIGLTEALGTHNPLIVLGSLLIGVVIGETAQIEAWLTRFGDLLQKRLSRGGSPVSQAFVTSSLLFCVGPLSILGPLHNGLTGNTQELLIKATLDGFAALAFSATLGWGVLLSVGTILLYQGAISLGAHALAPVLTTNPETIVELTATGGIILVAVGLKLLNIRDLRVANYLPALVFAPVLVALVALWPQLFH